MREFYSCSSPFDLSITLPRARNSSRNQQQMLHSLLRNLRNNNVITEKLHEQKQKNHKWNDINFAKAQHSIQHDNANPPKLVFQPVRITQALSRDFITVTAYDNNDLQKRVPCYKKSLNWCFNISPIFIKKPWSVICSPYKPTDRIIALIVHWSHISSIWADSWDPSTSFCISCLSWALTLFKRTSGPTIYTMGSKSLRWWFIPVPYHLLPVTMLRSRTQLQPGIPNFDLPMPIAVASSLRFPALHFPSCFSQSPEPTLPLKVLRHAVVYLKPCGVGRITRVLLLLLQVPVAIVIPKANPWFHA